MKSWQSLSAFLSKLGEGRMELTAEKKAFLKNLVADCTDIPCKVENIYEHLQTTTRYFSIQLGIGGWQPIAATDVEKRKYSDCKGLSNYMVAMLAAVGVEGRYLIIKAGEDEKLQYEDFPNAQFNHAIACVPMEKDTIWLECTSQSQACGFMGSFTNDRMALLVSPEGGKIVHTPIYDEKVNFIHKKGFVKVGLEGEATAEATILYSGIKQDIASQLSEVNADTRKKYVYETLKIDNATINNMSFSRQKTRIPIVEQKLNLTIEPLASNSGKRLFLPINVFSKWTKVDVEDWVNKEQRKLMSREATPLLMYGFEPERAQFIRQVKHAIWTLIEHIQRNGWSVKATEMDLSGKFSDTPVKGKADVVLTRNNELCVIDLKWGGRNYREQLIKNGEDLQLVMYSRLLTEDDDWAHTAYFIIEPARLLARNKEAFIDVKPLAAEDDAFLINQNIWQKMLKTYEWRLLQVQSGKVEIRTATTEKQLEELYGMELLDVLEMKKTEARFDDYRTLIGLVR